MISVLPLPVAIQNASLLRSSGVNLLTAYVATWPLVRTYWSISCASASGAAARRSRKSSA